MISKIDSGHLGGLIHKLIGKQGIIAYYVDMIAVCRMNYIINSNVAVK